MKKVTFLFITLLWLSFVGCQENDSLSTPTPFVNLGLNQTGSNTGQIVPVEINDLAINPAFYQGAIIELTGQYKRLPQVVCEGETYQSQATYGLRKGELMAYATGYQDEIRALLPEGIMMTVVGEWRYWRGPVGCGKRAQMQEIWYLDVASIVAPNPLVKITVTPSGEVVAQATIAQPTVAEPTAVEEAATPLPVATPTLDGDDLATAVTPTDSLEPDPLTSTPTLTADDATVTVTATGDSIGTATATPTLTGNDASPTTTPTGTIPSNGTTAVTPLSAGSATPTSAVAAATATPSPTPSSSIPATTITKPALNDEEPVGDILGTNETHSWTIEASSNDEITIYFAVAENVGAKVTLLDSNNNLLTDASTTSSAPVARIQTYSIASAGIYKINVNTTTGSPTDYALIVLLANSYEYVLQGFLNSGSAKTIALAGDTDHFWAFLGDSGDTINLTTMAEGGANLFVEIWFEGDVVTEGTNITQTLSDSGIYFIWIGEEDYASATYTILLTGN